MKTQQIIDTVTEVADTSKVILGVLEQADPQVAPEAMVAGNLVVLLSELATKAIAAYAAAGGIDITPENILKLLPNPAPLTPPTA